MNRRPQDSALLLAGFAVSTVIVIAIGTHVWALIEPWF